MKKIAVRCWRDEAACECGKAIPVYFTVPDFGDAVKLFICLHCGAILAVDPETEHYSGMPFEKLRNGLECPSCRYSLADVVPYPDTFLCPDLQHTGLYSRVDRTIPPAASSVVMEFWNPYDR
jgi:rubredoxin